MPALPGARSPRHEDAKWFHLPAAVDILFRLDDHSDNSLQDWFSGAAGQRLLTAEAALVSGIVEGVYGHQGLQISSCPEAVGLIEHSAVVGRIRTHLTAPGWLTGDLVADPLELPLQDDSLQLLVLHHVLEQLDDQSACLAEAARILAPHGVLVVVAFNRSSLWGLIARLRRRRVPPTRCGFLDLGLLARRLREHKLEPMVQKYLGHGWPRLERVRPTRLERIGGRLWHRHGGSCVMVARKTVQGATPLKLRPIRVTRGLPAAANGAGAWCEPASRRSGSQR